MGFFKNKHVILAMFIAPVLAIIAYFAVDRIVGEKPHQIKQGQTYKLAANPNCRYPSGLCTLRNGDIEVTVRIERVTDTAAKLILQSNTPVAHALASFAAAPAEPQPRTLYRSAAEGDTWNAEFKQAEIQNSTLRLALEISDSMFYAETPAVFIDYETTFSRENFSK
jgi:hypothetical protein